MGDDQDAGIEVQRYDRFESRYLTTGDFSALQQMNTEYPMETRTLFEKVLQIGEVNDPNISNKFLMFYQDSVLQTLISDAETKYANMDGLNEDFTNVYNKLKEWIPNLKKPLVYAQIGALDQSVIIGEQSIGISLDKYMGKNYPLYKKYYSKGQTDTMTREYIVPDAFCFYLLSSYQVPDFESRPQLERDLHMGKIMWVVNQAMGKRVFHTIYTDMVNKYMEKNKSVTIEQLLKSENYSNFK
jgi:hypothetical protein